MVLRPVLSRQAGTAVVASGLYFRIMMIGFFEGLDSERSMAWRLADSLTLRQFLSIGLDEKTPDHGCLFAVMKLAPIYEFVVGRRRKQH